MPVEITQGSLPARDKTQVEARDTSTWENFKTGFGVGIKQTTGSLVTDILAAKRAKREYEQTGESAIPEDEWNETNEFFVPGVEWEPHITIELAERMRDAYVANQQFSQTPGIAKWGGALAGGLIDPVNLIPLAGAVPGKVLTSMARVGAANAMLEFGLTPVLKAGYEARGEEFGADDVLMNMGIAFAAGGVLSGGASGLGYLVKRMRGTNLNSYTTADRIIDESFKNQSNLTVESNLSQVINGQVLNTSSLQPRSGGQDFIGNRRLDTVADDFFVDSYGTVFRNVDDTANETVRFGFNTNGNIVITGSQGLIAKLSNRIQQILPDQNKIEIVTGDEITRLNNRQDFVNWSKEAKRFYTGKDNFSDDIDQVFVAQNRDGSIKIEIDPKTNKKTAFRTLNKKQLKKDRDVTTLPSDEQLESLGLVLEGNRIIDTGDSNIQAIKEAPVRIEAQTRKQQILENFEDIQVTERLNDVEYDNVVRQLAKTLDTSDIERVPTARDVNADDDARVSRQKEIEDTQFDQNMKNNQPVEGELKNASAIVQETARNPQTYVYGRIKDLGILDNRDVALAKYGIEIDDTTQTVIVREAPQNASEAVKVFRRQIIEKIKQSEDEYTRVEGEKATARCAAGKGLVE